MNIIKKLRKERGLSQQDLANAVHVHQTSVSQWETGRTNPDTAQAIVLADYFNVTTDYILGRSDDSTPPFKAPTTFQNIPMAPLPDKLQKKEAPDLISEAEALRIFAEGKKGGPLTQEELNRLDEFIDIFIKSLNK